MKLDFIAKYAAELVGILKPFCKRIEIAGSIRRQCEDCKDIEIVCIPDSYKLAEHFLLTSRSKPHEYVFLKKGASYQQFKWKGQTVDLFTPKADNWGWIYFIRTGPKDWNIRAINRLKKNGITSNKGYLWGDNMIKLETPEEEDVFNFLGIGFYQPERRR